MINPLHPPPHPHRRNQLMMVVDDGGAWSSGSVTWLRADRPPLHRRLRLSNESTHSALTGTDLFTPMYVHYLKRFVVDRSTNHIRTTDWLTMVSRTFNVNSVSSGELRWSQMLKIKSRHVPVCRSTCVPDTRPAPVASRLPVTQSLSRWGCIQARARQLAFSHIRDVNFSKCWPWKFRSRLGRRKTGLLFNIWKRMKFTNTHRHVQTRTAQETGAG